ncbi:MAG: HyaD/HybD family hydrogenase maturation endopeptidase [Myxococcota bacterium]|nr:HyaD/HybD family hydrogenase maturation endopeptidase [Myxococcota bacterium]
MTRTGTLLLGIGNVLMGDEGVGVHVVRRLEGGSLPPGVDCLDGGTGGFALLEPMQEADRVVLVDATSDGAPAGTLRRLRPRFASDYPPTLTAHDIGLKDLLDAFYLLGTTPDVTLFAVSIDPLQDMTTELSPPLRAKLPAIAARVRAELEPGRREDAA